MSAPSSSATTASSPSSEVEASRRRRLFAYATDHGFDRDERIELAEYVLRRDIGSWKELSDADVCRLLDHFQGHEYIGHLISLRP